MHIQSARSLRCDHRHWCLCSLILKAADSERAEQRWVPDCSPRAGLGHPGESKPDGDGLGVGTQDLPTGEPVVWANLPVPWPMAGAIGTYGCERDG